MPTPHFDHIADTRAGGEIANGGRIIVVCLLVFPSRGNTGHIETAPEPDTFHTATVLSRLGSLVRTYGRLEEAQSPYYRCQRGPVSHNHRKLPEWVGMALVPGRTHASSNRKRVRFLQITLQCRTDEDF
jgi:hypothetical protein